MDAEAFASVACDFNSAIARGGKGCAQALLVIGATVECTAAAPSRCSPF